MNKKQYLAYTLVLCNVTSLVQSTPPQDKKATPKETFKLEVPIDPQKIVRKRDIETKMAGCITDLCSKNEFCLNDIPESMTTEYAKRQKQALKNLTTLMNQTNRDYLTSDEIEAEINKTLGFFLTHVSYVIVARLAREVLDSFDFSCQAACESPSFPFGVCITLIRSITVLISWNPYTVRKVFSACKTTAASQRWDIFEPR